MPAHHDHRHRRAQMRDDQDQAHHHRRHLEALLKHFGQPDVERVAAGVGQEVRQGESENDRLPQRLQHAEVTLPGLLQA